MMEVFQPPLCPLPHLALTSRLNKARVLIVAVASALRPSMRCHADQEVTPFLRSWCDIPHSKAHSMRAGLADTASHDV